MGLWEFLIMCVLFVIAIKLNQIKKEFEELNSNMRMIQMNFIKRIMRSDEK